MNISYRWLQSFIDEDLPKPDVVADVLTHGAYEVEGFDKVDDDTVFDVDVLPNRASDSLGHEGVARELAVLLSSGFTSVDPEVQTDKNLKASDLIQLSIDTNSCRRALKRLAFDVEVGPSPEWLKKQLAALGQKSINNVVDITNYLTFELGQPVHAFDFDKLAGEDIKEISIRSAVEGEEITTLDGDAFTLKEGMLVIADSEKALDIAGIKGGQVSGIDNETTRVMLSVCSFDPATIRKASQKLNLRTDASKRFENDVPPAQSRRALERFSELIQEVADARISTDVCDEYPDPASAYKVGVTVEQVNGLLGTSIDKSLILDILERIGCEINIVDPKTNVVDLASTLTDASYSYGASVLRDAPHVFDCSSFVSWLFVQSGIRMPRISVDQFAYTKRIEENDLTSGDIVFANTRKDEGGNIYYETQEYIPGTKIPDGVDHCGVYLGDNRIAHATRHSNNESGGVVVESLSDSEQFKNITGYGRVPEIDRPRIVATIPGWRTDLRYGQDLIEEVGRVYGYENIKPVMPPKTAAVDDQDVLSAIRDRLVQAGFTEVKTYSLVDHGELKLENPVAEDKAYLRTTLGDNLRTVLDANQIHKPVLTIDTLQVFEIGKIFSADREAFSVAIGTDGDEGIITTMFDEISDLLGEGLSPDVSNGVGVITLSDFDSLTVDSAASTDSEIYSAITFRTPSAYPYVLRDVAVWTPAGTAPDTVKDIIRKAAGNLLVSVSLFDTYEKEDQISYAFKLVFQSDERTLSDKEVNKKMTAVEATLEENKGFEVR